MSPPRVFADHGRRITLAVGGIVTVIGTASCAVAPTYELFLAARFVAGAGAAFVLTGGQIVVADITSSQNRGRVMAIYQAPFSSRSAPARSRVAGWPKPLVSPLHSGSPRSWLAVFAAGMVPRPGDRQLAHQLRSKMTATPLSARGELAAVMAAPGFILICLVGFATTGARTGALFNVIPIFAEEEIGLGTDEIGIGIGLISIVGLLFVYPSGLLVDRFGRKAIIVPSALFSAAAMFLFGLSTSFEFYLFASLLWSTASGISGATPAAYAADIAPPGMTAPAMGLFRAISDSGYVIGPLALGALADATSSVRALQATAATLLVIGLIFALAPESLNREPKLLPDPQHARFRLVATGSVSERRSLLVGSGPRCRHDAHGRYAWRWPAQARCHRTDAPCPTCKSARRADRPHRRRCRRRCRAPRPRPNRHRPVPKS